MARGTPDWGKLESGGVLAPTDETAEIAARLGSPVTYSRTGNVLWMDGFEFGLAPWNVENNGVGATVNIDGVRSQRGRFSAKLTTGAVNGNYAQVWKAFNPPGLGKTGLEASFSFASAAPDLHLQINHRNGAKAYTFEASFHGISNRIDYLNSAGVYITLANYNFYNSAFNMFHTAKIVVDLSTLTWRQIHFGPYTYDLTGIAAYQAADVTAERTTFAIYAYTYSAVSRVAYVDDVIITTNEP